MRAPISRAAAPWIATLGLLVFGATGCSDKGGGDSGAEGGTSADTGDDGTSSGTASTTGGTATTTGGTATTTGGTATTTGGTATTTGGTATTTAGTASTTSSSSGGDTDCGFVCAPDGGGSNMCDIFAQDCLDGQKCTAALVDGGVGNICVPIDPDPHPPGDPCTRDNVTGEDNCELGSLCVPDPDPELMRCFSLCMGTSAAPECEDADATCVLADGGATPICFPTCDPLVQDCNIVGWGCYLNVGAGEPFICAPDRAPVDSGVAGSTCAELNGCHPGLLCVGAEGVAGCTGGSCCAPFCDTSDPGATAECPGADMGEECIALFMMPVPGYETVGICSIPA